MKIPMIRAIRTGLGITALAATCLAVAPKTNVHRTVAQKPDSFEYVNKTNTKINSIEILPSVYGSSDAAILSKAPSPQLSVKGEKKNAKIVVDLTKNILYYYDDNGKPQTAYLVASGKSQSPSKEIISIVSHVETYPYRTAPKSTKRYRSPKSFGPKAIILDKLDTLKNERIQSGQFIHGNNDFSSLGNHASLGCIRMDNEVIKTLATKVKRGDLIIFRRFKIK